MNNLLFISKGWHWSTFRNGEQKVTQKFPQYLYICRSTPDHCMTNCFKFRVCTSCKKTALYMMKRLCLPIYIQRHNHTDAVYLITWACDIGWGQERCVTRKQTLRPWTRGGDFEGVGAWWQKWQLQEIEFMCPASTLNEVLFMIHGMTWKIPKDVKD